MILETEPVLAAGGDAVARAPDGRVVFVAGAAPSERVRVEILKDNRSFLRARVVEVLAPSPVRVEPRCPHFEACGGCTLQHVAPEAQTESKDRAMREAVARVGKVDLAGVEVAPPWSGAAYGYRTRARLAVGPQREVGYREKASHRIVDVTVCPILAPPLERARGVLREAARAAVREPRKVRPPREAPELHLVAAGERVSAALPRGFEAAESLLQEAGLELDARLPAADDFGPLELQPRVFAQANDAGNQALLEELERLLAAEGPFARAVELYAGSGNLTRVVARHAAEVVAIESAGPAVELAQRTRPENVTFEVGSVEEVLRGLERAELVVLDPPRIGASEAALGLLAALEPRLILYLSCDPATLARDVGRLEASGYRLDRLRLFDFYPQTPHAEVLGRLRAAGAAGHVADPT